MLHPIGQFIIAIHRSDPNPTSVTPKAAISGFVALFLKVVVVLRHYTNALYKSH